MAIATGTLVFAAGAFLVALDWTVGGVGMAVIGVVLMALGASGVAAALVFRHGRHPEAATGRQAPEAATLSAAEPTTEADGWPARARVRREDPSPRELRRR